MNKRGNFELIMFLGLAAAAIMVLLVVFGFVMAFVDYGFEIIYPEVTSLGTAGDANLSQYGELALTPVDTIINQFGWFAALLYIMGFLGLMVIAFIYRSTASVYLLPFYVSLVILLVIGAITMSMFYETFYDSDDDIGAKLQEYTIFSYLMIYSPAIVLIFSIIIGVVLFSGVANEGGGI